MVYNGDEKYIFISYAHADSPRVLPIVEALSKDGFRVWYDTGIEAGTEWPEYIEERLASSHVVLVFMSPSAVASRNCRNEINFALELKKEVLVIYLEETTLLKGMRLQLNSTQSLFRAHHETEETFVRELLNARILQSCRDEAVSRQTQTVAAAAAQAITEKKKTKNGKLPIYIMLGALLAAVLLLVGIIAFGNRDKDEKDNADTPTAQTTPATEESTAPTEPEVVEMSDELFDYTLKIEGTVIKLPCKYEVLTAAGWTISASGYSDTMRIPGNSYESFTMSCNGKKITASAYNMSGNAKQIKDCMIGGISWDAHNEVDIQMAKGITADSTVEEIVEAFGTPNSRNDYDTYSSIKYQETDSMFNEISFTCYTDPDERKYSSVSVENFLATEEDKTETNPEVPEYLSQYKKPDQLGTDFKSGVVEIQGDLYQLPAPVSAFTDNGWKIVEQPSAVMAGNTEEICIEKNGRKLYLGVLNFAEYQTLPENCAVYRCKVYAEDSISVLLPNGITMDATKADVEAAVTEEFDYYEGSYSYNWSYSEYDPRDYEVSINVDVETGKIQSITVRCQTWQYE